MYAELESLKGNPRRAREIVLIGGAEAARATIFFAVTNDLARRFGVAYSLNPPLPALHLARLPPESGTGNKG